MFTMVDLAQPDTIEEAYNILTSNKTNAVLGGCAFLRLSSGKIGTAIDLSNLNLNNIKELDDEIEIGAMTTFRDIETSPLLNQYFNGVLPGSVSDVIGVQFRNIVTIGATVFSKYGFSDLIPALLALDTDVELCKGGRMPLEVFLDKPNERDILVNILIKKNKRKAAYHSMRKSRSDFPILNVAVSKLDHQWRIVVGARPGRAKIAKKASEELSNGDLSAENIEKAANTAAEELSFESNMRGSTEYRKAICKVLVKRAVAEVLQCK